MNTIQTASVVLITLGACLPVMCLVKMHLLRRFKKRAVVTNAFIKQAERRTGYKNSVYYVLQIQYKPVDSRISYTGQAVSYKKYKAGESIPIMYLTAIPQKFKTDFGKRLPWLLAFSMVFLGLIIWFCYWLLSLEHSANTSLISPPFSNVIVQVFTASYEL